jgi:MFS family permease
VKLSPRGRQLALVALVQVLGLSVWFSATAVVPSLRIEWNLTSASATWLTASVQIGFVVGALASTALNLADRIRPQSVMAASALGAGGCTIVLALFAGGLSTAIPLRFATGVFLAGIYPIGMKLTASWSSPAQRGRAFGVLLGALTLGSALPHLIGGLGPLSWRAIMAAAAGLSVIAAIISLSAIVPGPNLDTRPVKPNARYALAMFTQRGPRLANLGYFGHMWELYALWTWLAVFVIAGREDRGDELGWATGIVTFLAIGVAGVFGCLVGGWASDRFGRPPAAVVALVISGICCLLSPLFFAVSTPILVAFLLVWGASVIADSGVFSTSLSETVDPRYVGTALTVQTAIGFTLTVLTIQFVPIFANVVGWQYAFLLLAPGPIAGALAMNALRRNNPQQKENDYDEFDICRPSGRPDGGVVPHRR